MALTGFVSSSRENLASRIRQVAAENERTGVCEIARQRLQYRPKEK